MIAWGTAPEAVCLMYCFCPVTGKSYKNFGLRGSADQEVGVYGQSSGNSHAALHTQVWSPSVGPSRLQSQLADFTHLSTVE